MNEFSPTAPSNSDIAELITWRRALHQHPELSGEERETALRIGEMLTPTQPDQIYTGLGGHGVAAVYDSGIAGPTVLLRCETDALPIEELGEIAHRSTISGISHLCGHDGHAAIMLGMARQLAKTRLPRGRVVLLFQPAEENGAGAVAVIADPRFASIAPDYAFSLHNMPGFAFGTGVISAGPANCASRGMQIKLTGSTAHAASPETGRSPMQAISRLMPALEASGPRGPLVPGFAMVTVTHATMGAASFGVAPGGAEVFATLRTVTNESMAALVAKAEQLVQAAAEASDLSYEISYHDVFSACDNDPSATHYLQEGAVRTGLKLQPLDEPLRASEDFGLYGAQAKSAMLFLGAGTDTPMVHTPEYDFPDDLIALGIGLFSHTLTAFADDQLSEATS
ncbi:MAG: amidohydrolase [Rhodobacteraceae bacterium]|nr:amidohydrolase [Paracoccaceae bacterium]